MVSRQNKRKVRGRKLSKEIVSESANCVRTSAQCTHMQLSNFTPNYKFHFTEKEWTLVTSDQTYAGGSITLENQKGNMEEC